MRINMIFINIFFFYVTSKTIKKTNKKALLVQQVHTLKYPYSILVSVQSSQAPVKSLDLMPDIYNTLLRSHCYKRLYSNLFMYLSR